MQLSLHTATDINTLFIYTTLQEISTPLKDSNVQSETSYRNKENN